MLFMLFPVVLLLVFLRYLLLAPVLPNRGCATQRNHWPNVTAASQQQKCAATRHIVFLAPIIGACGELKFPLIATCERFSAQPAVGMSLMQPT